MEFLTISNEKQTIGVHIETAGLVAHFNNYDHIILVYENGTVWDLSFSGTRKAGAEYRALLPLDSTKGQIFIPDVYEVTINHVG